MARTPWGAAEVGHQSGVMRCAKTLVPEDYADVDAGENARVEVRRRAAYARVERAIARLRAELGVEGCARVDAKWPLLEPVAYRGARITGVEDGSARGPGPAFLVAGGRFPWGAVHAEQLARDLGWTEGPRGLTADYRKLYAYAHAGLLIAFVSDVTRARHYLVRDERRLLAADAIRRLGGRVPKAQNDAQDVGQHFTSKETTA